MFKKFLGIPVLIILLGVLLLPRLPLTEASSLPDGADD